MALEFGFYDSYNHDRVYSAENMNDIFEGVLTNGVYAGVGDMFMVKPGIGLQATIGTGRAWFQMTWNKNRTIAPINFDIPDPVYDRIDTVCIRVRKNILERTNDFFIYKGNILVEPQPPVIQNTDETFYLPLANVTIRANSEEILPSDIEYLVGRERCPFVTSILQQTDISNLFAQWQDQFERWWDSVKDILSQVETGDFSGILSMLSGKVDRSDKATENDISQNSDSKWMTPKMTKDMIDSAIGGGLDDIRDALSNGVVTSFNGRTGAVIPTNGDYTAAQVGALSSSGGTISGNLSVTGTLKATGATTLSTMSTTGITDSGNLSVTGTSTLNGLVTAKGNLRLQGSSNYGSVLNFGDSDYVHISEPSNNAMEIKANSVNFVLSGSGGNANTNFLINGTNPFSGLTSNNNGLTLSLIKDGTIAISSASGTGATNSTTSKISWSSSTKMLLVAASYGGATWGSSLIPNPSTIVSKVGSAYFMLVDSAEVNPGMTQITSIRSVMCLLSNSYDLCFIFEGKTSGGTTATTGYYYVYSLS